MGSSWHVSWRITYSIGVENNVYYSNCAQTGNNRTLTRLVQRSKSNINLTRRAQCASNFPVRNMSQIAVDAHRFSAILLVPREAGLLHFGVRSVYILGLQIGSILSRLNRCSFSKSGP